MMQDFLQNIRRQDIRNALAFAIVTWCFIIVLVMLFHPIPPDNKDLLNMVIGFVFGGTLSGVIGFFFGSSKKQNNYQETDQEK